ncbi:MAG: N-6 DNA methylase [Anaerolineales bacterium]|nr:N-6 DNA methylase [Anaerolineales bacterium]
MSDDPSTDDDFVEEEETETLEEGQIYDFITGEPVKDSATERTLQVVAHSLVDEYGFELDQLERAYKIVYELINEEGKTRKLRPKIDIAVFADGRNHDEQDNITHVCLVQSPNTKATDRKKGVFQLEQVMGALPQCDYGLWTNGTDLVFKQKLTGDGRLQPEYVDLYDLPGEGETVADLDKPDRQTGRIATGDNLQRTFARIHDYIYGNQGLKKDVAFWQILNLFFCKIHDERTTGNRRFWVRGTERNTREGQRAIASRIKELFAEVKADERYSRIFSDRDSIDLDDRVLAYVVGELSRYNLLDTDVDIKGAAYEEITASMLKSQRGQFFTPTNVIRLMVQMIDPGEDKDLTDPQYWPKILDPACGSGRFLTYALDHVRHKLADQLFPDAHPLLRIHRLNADPKATKLLQNYAEQCLYGVDFDPDLRRAARMNMILNNDGHGNIFSFNSLEFPLMLDEQSRGKLKKQHRSKDTADLTDPVRMRLEGDLESFDIVFTNPPFGAKIPIDDPDILEQFDLAHNWSVDSEGRWLKGNLQRSVAPEILFVERCVNWVKPGTGLVAIVLPDGILGNPNAEYIRYWILQRCQVLASVDLPVEAFLPQVGVQASLLFLRRKSQTEMDLEKREGSSDYTVFMAVAEKVGHDRRGNEIFERDPDGAEKVYPETKSVLRRRRGQLEPIQTTVQEKRVDDDMPRIAEAFVEYKLTGRETG